MFVFEIWHQMSGFEEAGGEKEDKGKTDEGRRTFVTDRNRPASAVQSKGNTTKDMGSGGTAAMFALLQHCTPRKLGIFVAACPAVTIHPSRIVSYRLILPTSVRPSCCRCYCCAAPQV